MKKLKLIADNSQTIEKAFEEFQKFNEIKDLSQWTITSYQATYRAFIESYDETNLCGNVDIQTINNFIIHLKQKRKVNNISINSHLRNMRAFLNYCIRLGYIEEFRIPSLRAEKKVKETYTDSELVILLRKPDMKKCSFVTYRNWVFINYLIGTGNRVSTVVNIKIGDIDFDNDTIILKKTKNRNQQIIPLSSSLKIILLEYIKYRKGTDEDYLFCTATEGILSADCIKSSIRKYNQARGVMKTSIHLFRHTFAKNWILNGRRYI